MTVEEFKNKFVKVSTNQLKSYEYRSGKKVPMLYRRGDFTHFAQGAFDKGEDFFYTEPVNPLDPYGRHRLSEPKYIYKLKSDLTEQEFNEMLQLVNSEETR